MTAPTDTSAWPVVSVCMLAYNRREMVDLTLTKLRDELDYPADRLEIIVVDNASEDGTAEMVRERHPQAKVIETGKNLGAPALNHGFEAASGDYYLILDDDCYIEGDALKRAITEARDQDADLVSFAVISGEDPSFRFDLFFRTGLIGFWGCAFIVSKRAVDRVGGYDPDMFIWVNEAEFTLRLLDAGMRHVYMPSVVAVHMKGPPPEIQSTFSRLMILRHMIHLAVKHLRPWDLVGALLSLGGRVVLVSAARGELKEGLDAAREGVRTGLRARKPARPSVSALYRHNMLELTNPLALLGRPRSDPGKSLFVLSQARLERFLAERPGLYPARDQPASLQL